jgi:glycosyltransferase involved in cell wall biosynthesis
LEYVRLGIPVIVAWTPTIARHFPEDTVRFVREFSAVGVAEALEWILADPERARQQAARAQRLPIARAWQESEATFVSMVQEVGRVEPSP